MGMYSTVYEAMGALEAALDTFQWAYPGLDQNRGEMELDHDKAELRLEIWVRDNDDPDDEELKALVAVVPVTLAPARDQIRGLIHSFLCHEADEQIYFGNERPFYPH